MNESGIGLSGLLLVTFIVLKLVGVISWSWIWVLSPFWIPAGLGLLFWIILMITLGIGYLKFKK